MIYETTVVVDALQLVRVYHLRLGRFQDRRPDRLLRLLWLECLLLQGVGHHAAAASSVLRLAESALLLDHVKRVERLYVELFLFLSEPRADLLQTFFLLNDLLDLAHGALVVDH